MDNIRCVGLTEIWISHFYVINRFYFRSAGGCFPLLVRVGTAAAPSTRSRPYLQLEFPPVLERLVKNNLYTYTGFHSHLEKQPLIDKPNHYTSLGLAKERCFMVSVCQDRCLCPRLLHTVWLEKALGEPRTTSCVSTVCVHMLIILPCNHNQTTLTATVVAQSS